MIEIYKINGIDISDANYDKVCLNCIHWRSDTQLYGSSRGVKCARGMGQTNPDDSCSMFEPNRGADIQNPNRYFDKKMKMEIWKKM